MSAEAPLGRAQFLAASAAVATSSVMLPLVALADDEEVRILHDNLQPSSIRGRCGAILEDVLCCNPSRCMMYWTDPLRALRRPHVAVVAATPALLSLLRRS